MRHVDHFDWEAVTIRARKTREGLQSQRENLKSPGTLENGEGLTEANLTLGPWGTAHHHLISTFLSEEMLAR